MVKRMVGFAQDIPGSPGEMMKNRGHLEAMIDQIFADTGRLPLNRDIGEYALVAFTSLVAD